MTVSDKPDLVVAVSFEWPQIVTALRELAVLAPHIGKIDLVPPEEFLCQLVNPDGPLQRNRHGLNIFIVRLEDWNYIDVDGTISIDDFEIVQRRCETLIDSVRTISANQDASSIVAICETKALRTGAMANEFERFEVLIESACSALPRTTVVRVDNTRKLRAFLMGARERAILPAERLIVCE